MHQNPVLSSTDIFPDQLPTDQIDDQRHTAIVATRQEDSFLKRLVLPSVNQIGKIEALSHNSDNCAILVNGDKKARKCSLLQHSPTASQEVLMVPMLATLTLQVVQ
jgi:hypothetical protein